MLDPADWTCEPAEDGWLRIIILSDEAWVWFQLAWLDQEEDGWPA
jgi:hypothetical protein